ncbi:MAG TPA: hypothetical protein VJ579_05265 [Candidatus Paceibacterota bacterium]|nr:hypothetical protein [Candidatus Paceibacterota bacterium]
MPTPMQAVRHLERKLVRLEKETRATELAIGRKMSRIDLPCPYCKKSSPLPEWMFDYHVTRERTEFNTLTPLMQLNYSNIICPKCKKPVYLEDWNARHEVEFGRVAHSIGPLRTFVITYRKYMKIRQSGY